MRFLSTAGILQPEKPDQMASEGGKKRGHKKTIERFDGKAVEIQVC